MGNITYNIQYYKLILVNFQIEVMLNEFFFPIVSRRHMEIQQNSCLDSSVVQLSEAAVGMPTGYFMAHERLS